MKITKEMYAQQQATEMTYDRGLIFDKAYADLTSDAFMLSQMNYGATLLGEWLASEFHPGQLERVKHVAMLDLNELSHKIHTEIVVSCQKPTTLVAISAKCASMLKMADKPDAIQTMAEVISVIADADLFNLYKSSLKDDDGSYMVKALCSVEDDIQAFINNTAFLPPMIHRPKKLRGNRDSGYITQGGDSLILGGFIKHHDWDICLDVLNIMNSNEFELDEAFLKCQEEPIPVVEEQGDVTLSYEEKKKREAKLRAIENFPEYKEHCSKLYKMYLDGTNSLYFTHKVDTRGRVYSCGFHLSPQGNSYKKGMLNSKKREIPTGVTSFMEQCK